MFDHFSKQLEIRPKYSATSLIFKSLLGVWNAVKHGPSSLIYYSNYIVL